MTTYIHTAITASLSYPFSFIPRTVIERPARKARASIGPNEVIGTSIPGMRKSSGYKSFPLALQATRWSAALQAGRLRAAGRVARKGDEESRALARLADDPGVAGDDLCRYNDIIRLAFEGEGGIDQSGVHRFVREFADWEILINEGEIRQRICWILTGEVYVGRRNGTRFRVLSALDAGEIIGEMSFFDRSVCSATVIARAGCRRWSLTAITSVTFLL